MIIIEERKSIKCPTETSLFVSFTYNQNILAIVKNLGFAFYDAKTKEWETGLQYLSELITKLSAYDEISLKILPYSEKEQKADKVYQLAEIKTPLFDYQKDGVQYGLNHNKWLLLDATGLGKSLTMISLAYNLKKQGKVNKVLVICGINALKTNWKKEIEKHSDLSCRILGEYKNKKGALCVGSVADRVKQLQKPIDEFFTITNIETIRDDRIVKELTKKKPVNKFDMIIVDEVHKVKDSESAQGKALLKLDAPYKVGMTGTLIMNNPLDAYAPLVFIDRQKNKTLTAYKSYFCNYNSFKQIIGYKNISTLKDILSDCSLRRTKDLLKLPPKTIINEYIDLDTKHQQFYQNIVNGIVDEIDKVHISTASLLAMVTRLRQATALPSILTSEKIPSSKVNRCLELTNELIENGEKVVIFSTFKDTCYEISKQLKYKHVLCTGNEKDLMPFADQFQTDKDCKVFIGTWQKCGTGITLTSGTSMIFLDTPWTEAEYLQAQDRIYRIGTNKSVTIYNLICTGTIDERVLQLVTTKGAMADYIIDDKLSDTTINSLRQYIEDLKQ